MLEKLDRVEGRVAAALGAWQWWIVGAISLLYLSVTCVLAHHKLFWNDELFTVYIAGLPTLADIWAILATGVEQLPPTFHLLTRLLMGVFGEHHLTVRLPAILGVGVMGICLFVIVSRRTSPGYGLIGMLLPLATQPPVAQAYSYAYEARPYGLVLGLSAASLLCWQSATEGRRRILSLAGLTATLAAALASHYYAVLVFVPLAAGELARSLGRRRLDLPIWIAFGLATIPLWLFLPLIRAGRTLATTFWAQPQWAALVGFYHNILSPAAVPFVAILLILCLYAVARASAVEKGKVPPPASPPLHEVVAALGYLAIPALALVLAKFVTGAFTDRYVLPAVIGLALIVPWGAYHLLDRRATMATVLAALLGAWFVPLVGLQPARQLRQDRVNLEAVYRLFRMTAPGDVPIVIASPHAFLQLTYYAPPDLASRFVYLVDPATAVRYLGTDTAELGIREFRRWTPLLIEDYPAYLARHPRFLVYSRGPWVWLLPELEARRFRVQVAALDPAAFPFYLMEAGPDTATSENPAAPR